MSISSNLKNGSVTITLGNRFDFTAVEEFRRAYTEHEGRSYVVDFRHTEYMDSSGLGMLLNMKRALKDLKTSIKLTSCRPQVKKVLLISRFETEFSID